MIRILVADDDKFIRRTLCTYLKSESDIEIVATADNGKLALELIEELHPDLALLDIEMPEVDGLTVTKKVCQHFPETKAVLLSSYDDQKYVNKAIEAGAIGYLLKTITAEELSQAIRFLDKGYLQLAPGLSSKLSSKVPATIERTTTEAKLVIPSPRSLTFPPVYDRFTLRWHRFSKTSGILLLAFFGTVLTFANTIEHKVTVKAPALISYTSEPIPISTATAGTIRSFKVDLNQEVEAGEIIATLDDSQLQAQKRQFHENIKYLLKQLSLIDVQIRNLNLQIDLKQRALERNSLLPKVNLNLERPKNLSKTALNQKEIKQAQAKIKSAQQELELYLQMANKGAISQLQLEKKEASFKEAKDKLAKLKRSQILSNPTSNARLAHTKEELVETRAESEAILAALNREKEAITEKKKVIEDRIGISRQEIQKINSSFQKTILRAPIAGIVQKLNLSKQEQIVNPGDSVAQIVPMKSNLIVTTLVSSEEIDKVKIGQIARFSFPDCSSPLQKNFEGTVSSISPNVSKIQKEEDTRIEDRIYQVTIKPKQDIWQTESRKCMIEAGMEGKAEIVTKIETYLRFFLRKTMFFD
jgi:HlyD family secretion protein